MVPPVTAFTPDVMNGANKLLRPVALALTEQVLHRRPLSPPLSSLLAATSSALLVSLLLTCLRSLPLCRSHLSLSASLLSGLAPLCLLARLPHTLTLTAALSRGAGADGAVLAGVRDYGGTYLDRASAGIAL